MEAFFRGWDYAGRSRARITPPRITGGSLLVLQCVDLHVSIVPEKQLGLPEGDSLQPGPSREHGAFAV